MHIEILSDESYDEFIAENDEAMIFWVAEGCIRCFEIVQPEFVILAQTLAELKPTFKLAIIDGSEFKDFVTEKKVDSFPRLEYFKRGRFEYFYENQQNGQAMLNFALQPTKEGAEKPKRYIWELDSSRDSGNIIHVNKFTFPEEVEKVKFGFLMLHAGGFDGAGSMKNAYDAFSEASKILAPISELKFFACDCGRGKDWGKARV
ncbi:unnamed protein product [Oikopleura dioica]|uniref:Thioredoxin domain-containing protein n=1 Tax=Oikopleura dioica TaxID=34765 RepID=E4XTN3_OIKDI|nr:unnamed protein product [Oikopleura dioica]